MTGRVLRVFASLGEVLRHTPMARWQWLNRLYARLVGKLHGSDEVQVGPFRVFVDPRDQVIAKKLILYGGFETREIELLCSFVKPGDAVLDVGANIGLYSLALSRAVGPSGRVVAVEPDPDNLALLKKNLARNDCTNVIVVPFALGLETGSVSLYQTDENRGALSTSDILGVGSAHAVSVQQRRGDEVMAELGLSPRVAKIDVEGAEPLVMEGLGGYLPEVLLFEFVPWQLRAAGHEPLAFLGNLHEKGYQLDLVDPDTGARQLVWPEDAVSAAEATRSDVNILAMRIIFPRTG